VREGAIVGDCRVIGVLEVTFVVCIIDYSMSGECGGGRNSAEKGWGEEGKKKKVREKEKTEKKK
jgi:hypothetical protein